MNNGSKHKRRVAIEFMRERCGLTEIHRRLHYCTGIHQGEIIDKSTHCTEVDKDVQSREKQY